MTLNLYLDFLQPPGCLAFRFDTIADAKEEPDAATKCLAIFFGRALDYTIANLTQQILDAGRVCRGPKPAEEYIREWQRRSSPSAVVRFGGGLYMLGYAPHFTDPHPLCAQAWRYIKTALDLVSDDAGAGDIFNDPYSYETTLPLRLLEKHNALPKLTFK